MSTNQKATGPSAAGEVDVTMTDAGEKNPGEDPDFDEQCDLGTMANRKCCRMIRIFRVATARRGRARGQF